MFITLFVTNHGSTNNVGLANAQDSIWILLFVTLLLIVISTKRKMGPLKEDFLSPDTTLTLKGLGVIFLIFGHLSLPYKGIRPFENSGYWAVIIFCFASGFGIAKKYGETDFGKPFLRRRFNKLAFPVWATFLLFYTCDFIFLRRVHSVNKMMFTFIGIIPAAPPNGPAWFITYSIYCYLLLWVTSLLRISPIKKVLFIILCSYLAGFIIKYLPGLENDFGIWIAYLAVFPVSFLLGLYRKKLFSILDSFYGRFPIAFLVVTLAMGFLFYAYVATWNLVGLQSWPRVWRSLTFTLRPVYLVLFVTMLAYVLERKQWVSTFLLFLGGLSLEIYLLHFPFMAYYDFFLFRRPMYVFFFPYVLLVLFLSYLLRRSTESLRHYCSQSLRMIPFVRNSVGEAKRGGIS